MALKILAHASGRPSSSAGSCSWLVAPQDQRAAVRAVRHESSQAGRPAWEGERRETAPVVEGCEERRALQVVGGRAAASRSGRTREGNEEAANAAPLPRLFAEVWKEHLRRACSQVVCKPPACSLGPISCRVALLPTPLFPFRPSALVGSSQTASRGRGGGGERGHTRSVGRRGVATESTCDGIPGRVSR